MMGRFDRSLAGLVLLALAALAPGEGLIKKDPIPDPAALTEPLKLVSEVFKPDLVAAKTANQKAAVAKKILDSVQGEKDGATRYALLTKARDIAAEAGGLDIAMAAVDELDKAFDIDVLDAKAKVLATAGKAAHTPEDHALVAQQYVAVAGDAVEAEKLPLALTLATSADAEARLADTPALVRFVQGKLAGLHADEVLYAKVPAAQKVLETAPDDAEANATVGRYAVFVLMDYERGVPMLAKSSDKALRSLAELDGTKPTTAMVQAELAGKWWEYADANKPFALAARLRAGYWYEEALPNLEGLTRTLAEKRAAEARDMDDADRLFLVNQPDAKAIAAARARIDAVETRPLGGQLFDADQVLAQTDKPYAIADVFQPDKAARKLKITVGPGVEIRGGKINLESPDAKGNAELFLAGTKAKPVILRNVEIDQPLGVTLKASNVIFDQCKFRKTGAWFAYYSSHWEMDTCLMYKCSFGNFNGIDYGFKFTGCTFVGMELPEIKHRVEKEKPFDYMDRLRKDWNVIKTCGFVDCTVPPTVFWCGEGCNFSYCKFAAGAAFDSDKATKVSAFVTGTKGEEPDAINKDNPPKRAGLTIEVVKIPFAVPRWAADCPILEVRYEQRLVWIVLEK